MSKPKDQPTKTYDSIYSIFIRGFWMLSGNAILLFAVLSILQHKGKILHAADIIFWITVVALLAARYLDIKFFKGLTAAGLPASMNHWRKYTAVLLICSSAIWIIAHLINQFMVNK